MVSLTSFGVSWYQRYHSSPWTAVVISASAVVNRGMVTGAIVVVGGDLVVVVRSLQQVYSNIW